MSLSQSNPEIPFEEVRERLRDPAFVLVNVLPKEAFMAEHIPGSVSLPLAEVSQRAREVLSDLTQEIGIYCANFT